MRCQRVCQKKRQFDFGHSYRNKKCEFISFRISKPSNSNYFPNSPSHTVRYLGIPISFQLNLLDAWDTPMKKLQKVVDMWSKLTISLSTKIIAIKSYILPIFSFHSCFLAIEPETINKIKATIRNFIWNGKRSKVSYEKIMKPKNQGGLNAPCIESALYAPKVKWLHLIATQRDSSWTLPAVTLIRETNVEYGHGLSALYLKPTSHTLHKIPSKFWRQALSTYWKFNKTFPIDLNDEDAPNKIRCLPIFNNPLITKNGRPLIGEKYKQLAAKGIVRVADLVFENKLGSRDQINSYYGSYLQKKTLETIFRCIPQDWMDCISCNPWRPCTDGKWAISDELGTPTIINSDNLHHLNNARPYCKIKGFMDTLDIPFDLPHLAQKYIKQALSNKRQSDALPQLKRLWEANVPSKFKDTSWLIHHKALWTGSKAKSAHSSLIPHHCHCGILETINHIFLECTHSKQILNAMTDEWTARTRLRAPDISPRTLRLHGWDLPLRTPYQLKSLWQRLYLTAIHSIWLGRCHNVYDGPPSSSIGRWIINTRKVDCLQPPLRGYTH